MEDKLYNYLLESYKAEIKTIANDIFEEVPDIIDWLEESIQGKEQFVRENLLETELAIMDDNSAVTFLEDFFVEEDIPKAEQKQYTKDSVLKMNKKVLQDKELINKIIKEIDKLFDYRIAKINNRILKRIYAGKVNFEAVVAYDTACRNIMGDLKRLNDFIKYYETIASRYGDEDATESPIFKVHEEFKKCYNEFFDKFENEYRKILENTYPELQRSRKFMGED